jgi:phage gp29-like protein
MAKEKIEFTIKSENKLSLPKISINSALLNLRNEELEELIPLYSVFLDRDTHLISEVQKRRMQLLSLPYQIESEDKKLIEFIEEYLKTIGFDFLLFELSLAIPYGFSCLDMIYEPIEVAKKAFFAPKRFYNIHPRFFRYQDEKLLLQKDSSNKIDPLTLPQKLLMHFHPSDSGSVADYALMRKLLFVCLIKHAVITSNMNYYENLGVPPVIVQYDSSDEDELKDILKQIQNLRSGSVGIFPKETIITLLEGKGSKPDFLNFIKYCDDSMSSLIVGNVLSGGVQERGSYAMAKVHDERRKDYLQFDAKLLAGTINRFLTLVVSLNFGAAKEFKFVFDTGDETDEELLSRVYLNLANAGYEIPIEHIETTFKIQGITKKEYAPAPAANAREANAKAAKKPITRIDKGLEELNLRDKNISGKLAKILSECDTYEDAYDIIANGYEGEEFAGLEDELTLAIANSGLLALDDKI